MRVIKFVVGAPCALLGLLVLLASFKEPTVGGNTPNELKANAFTTACILIGYGWTVINSKVKTFITFFGGAILLAIVLLAALLLLSNSQELMDKNPSKFIGAIIVQIILASGAFMLLNPGETRQNINNTILKPGESISKGFCPKCGDIGVKTTGQGYNPNLGETCFHLFLCIISGGGWIPFWGGWAIAGHLKKGEKVCLQCGEILQL